MRAEADHAGTFGARRTLATPDEEAVLYDVHAIASLEGAAIERLSPGMFRERYRSVFEGGEAWTALATEDVPTFSWDPASTSLRQPPFLPACRARRSPIARSAARASWRSSAAASIGLDGSETIDVVGLSATPGASATAIITRRDGSTTRIALRVRIDTQPEAEWFENGGILSYVTRKLIRADAQPS